MKWKRSAAAAMILACAASAMAHPAPKHEVSPSGLVHVLTDPDHLLAGVVLIGAGVAAGAGVLILRARRRRQAQRE